MKKPATLIIVFAIALSLAACGSNKEAEETAATKDVQTEAQAVKEDDMANESEIKDPNPKIEAEEETITDDEELTIKESADEFIEPTPEELEYYYDTEFGGVIITAYNGDAPSICIPAELDGNPVKSVKLINNNIIARLVLPDSVTVILYEAFSGCSNLTEITIPDSVTAIGGGAFYECSSLTEITIPDSVTVISGQAFYGCSNLTEVTIPDNSVIEIYPWVFYGCSSLTEITIPDNVILGIGTFYDCDGLKVTYQGQEYTYENDPGNWWSS